MTSNALAASLAAVRAHRDLVEHTALRAELSAERDRCRPTDLGNLARRIAECDDVIADAGTIIMRVK